MVEKSEFRNEKLKMIKFIIILTIFGDLIDEVSENVSYKV